MLSTACAWQWLADANLQPWIKNASMRTAPDTGARARGVTHSKHCKRDYATIYRSSIHLLFTAKAFLPLFWLGLGKIQTMLGTNWIKIYISAQLLRVKVSFIPHHTNFESTPFHNVMLMTVVALQSCLISSLSPPVSCLFFIPPRH